jgi:hypothetical protein
MVRNPIDLYLAVLRWLEMCWSVRLAAAVVSIVTTINCRRSLRLTGVGALTTKTFSWG